MKNKEKIAKYNTKKITCECGATICRSGMDKHKKTYKHFNLMKNL